MMGDLATKLAWGQQYNYMHQQIGSIMLVRLRSTPNVTKDAMFPYRLDSKAVVSIQRDVQYHWRQIDRLPTRSTLLHNSYSGGF